MNSLIERIFNIHNTNDFNSLAIDIYNYQVQHNAVYREYVLLLKRHIPKVQHVSQIPFLPVEFFKTHQVISQNNGNQVDIVFTSSGTTGTTTSRHFVSDVSLYEKSFEHAFKLFYGDIKNYCLLALLPNYLERQGSSLIYMVDSLIKQSQHPQSGYYLNEYQSLADKLIELDSKKQATILLGVTYALLEFAQQYHLDLKHTIVMETGGMKGKHKELTRDELHSVLTKKLGVHSIHSEYGMTELLSQAYSKGNGQFFTPPFMKVLIRDVNDPFEYVENGKTGGINIIDLANLNSCSFLEIKDLGKINANESFEVLGRFDYSDIRGCNLLVQ